MTERNAIPYDFGTARAAIAHATRDQRQAEQDVRDAAKDFGRARKLYQVALASKIVELRANGEAATLAQDLARGDDRVSTLRFEKDIAEGAYEAAKSAIFRHTADRRELEQLVGWSMRVAPDGQEVVA